MKPRIHTLLSPAAIAGLTLTAASANAAVIGILSSEAPSSTNTNDHIGTIQATVGDLTETVGSVASEGAVGDASRHVTASVFNGKISTGVVNGGNGGDVNAPNAAGYWTTGSHIEFDLDTTTNTLGYDISAINIIQRGDGFRPSINVTVSLRTVGGGFVELYNTGAVGTAGNVNQVAVTDDGGALLGSGIDGVRFDFGNPGLNWTWYRELDVIGTATVPEPSAAALLGLGALALLRRRRQAATSISQSCRRSIPDPRHGALLLHDSFLRHHQPSQIMTTVKRFRTVSSIAATAIAGWAFTAPLSTAAPLATLSSEAPSNGNTNNHVGTIQAKVGDLLETVGSVAAEGGTGDASRHVTASVFNGKISTGVVNGSNGGDINSPTASGIWGNNHFIEFDLDTSTNVRGYDISLIQIIQRGDHFRPGIHVTVSLREVGGSYTTLISPPDAGTGGNVNMYAITSDSGPLIASGIDGVRFDFSNTVGTISGWTWYRELDVVGEPTGSGPQITTITGIGGGIWELRLLGNPDTGYEFRSSPILDFNPGTLVENLASGVPALGTIGGDNDSVLTTDSNGDARVRMMLAGPANFVRAEIPPPPPPLFSTDFEADDGGFTVVDHSGGAGTAWEHGDPDSTGDGGSVTTGNDGSVNCWGTGIGNLGVYASGTDTSLVSPVIDLTGVAGATLSFAQAIDILGGDTFVVNVIDDDISGGITVLQPAVHISSPDLDVNSADWTTVPGVAITGGEPVRLEWRFTGNNDGTCLGAYLDDVIITVPGS